MSDLEIQYDKSQDVAYSNLIEQLNNQTLAKQKAYQDRVKSEIQQKQELMKLIDPMVLSGKLEVEVADNGVAQLRNTVTDFMKKNPNVSSAELGTLINDQLSQISQWNNKVKVIKSKLDEQFKNLPQDQRISKSNWMNAAMTDALYKDEPVLQADGTPAKDQYGTVQTRRVLKNLQELDTEADFARKSWDRNGDAFINLDAVNDDLVKKIKDAPKVTTDVTVSRGASRGRSGYTSQKTVEIPSFAVWDPKLEKPVVKTVNGQIDPNVYAGFVGNSGSANDRFVDRQSREALISRDIEFLKSMGFTDLYAKDGKTLDQDKVNKAWGEAELSGQDFRKKAWLTYFIEKNSGYTTREKEITKPPVTNITVVNPGRENTTAGLEWMKKVDGYIAAGDAASLMKMMKPLKSGSGTTKLKDIKQSGDIFTIEMEGDVDNREYIVSGANSDGSPKWTANPNKGKRGVEKIQINYKAPDASELFASTYQRLMGQNPAIETYQIKKLP